MKTKEWPRACTKAELYRHLNALPRKTVFMEMIEAIMNNDKRRNITEEKAKKVRTLRKNEVKQVLINLGELEEPLN